jgi:tRNA(Ile)-lysidine synthase
MDPTTVIEHSVRRALAAGDGERVVLAVSGGRDSMVMLDAAARVLPERVAAVVTVDHGTGPAATRGAVLAERTARALGLEVVRRRVRPAAATEDAWRVARWAVLREQARTRNARVATAHTRDDQIETVLIRVLRDSGARGLAGLAESSGTVVRPLLGIDRQQIDAYAAARHVAFVDDPSNASLDYLRNRIRLELLPALLKVRPELGSELLAVGGQAAAWRGAVERAVDAWVPYRVDDSVLVVAREVLLAYTAESLRVLWPAVAARAGVILDRRGTERLTSFTIQSHRGGRIQLSGGVEAVRHRDDLLLRRAGLGAAARLRRLADTTQLGAWRFVRTPGNGARRDEWEAALPLDRPLHVRTWHAGDRIVPAGQADGGARRVKRLLREAGIEAGIRAGWPVVLSGDEIVWVPGVRRGLAATVRSGRPVAVYRCERTDR